MSNWSYICFWGPGQRIGGQILVECFFGCEPVSAESSAPDQPIGQEMTDMTWRIARVLRRLFDRDPLRQICLLMR